jgi:hypothetical protein
MEIALHGLRSGVSVRVAAVIWIASNDRATASPPSVGGGHDVRCETCGNEYEQAFQISKAGNTHTFDSFEGAIQAFAPDLRRSH